MRYRFVVLLCASLPMFAHAWDPYPNYSEPPPEERAYRAPGSMQRPMGTLQMPAARPVATPGYRPAAPLATTVNPPISYEQATPISPPVPAAPIYVEPPANLPVATPNLARSLTPTLPPSASQPPVVSPVTYYAPTPAMAAAPIPQRRYEEPMRAERNKPSLQQAEHPWWIGMELFYDTYTEDSLDVKTHTKMAALTFGREYYSPGMVGLYNALEGRVSYGDSSYKSPSGKIASVPEEEYEARWKIGFSMMPEGKGFVPYTGLGLRYYRDNLKGEVTDLGLNGYDRNIFQLYIPLGVQFQTQTRSEWNIRSNLEYDRLFYGMVSSRLGTLPGYENAVNHQSSGYGIRADLLFGRTLDSGNGYEFGPFLRYWNVDDSETDSQAIGTFLEPENERLQVGASFKYQF